MTTQTHHFSPKKIPILKCLNYSFYTPKHFNSPDWSQWEAIKSTISVHIAIVMFAYESTVQTQCQRSQWICGQRFSVVNNYVDMFPWSQKLYSMRTCEFRKYLLQNRFCLFKDKMKCNVFFLNFSNF